MRHLVPVRLQLGADPAVEVALVRLERREEEAHEAGRPPSRQESAYRARSVSPSVPLQSTVNFRRWSDVGDTYVW